MHWPLLTRLPPFPPDFPMSKTHAPFTLPCSPVGELFISHTSTSVIECACIPSPCHALPHIGHATFCVAIPAAIAIAITIAATVTTITMTTTTTKMPHGDRHCSVAAVLLLQLLLPLPSPPPPHCPHRLCHLHCCGTLATITAIPTAAPSLPPLPSLPPSHCHLHHPHCHDTIASTTAVITKAPCSNGRSP